VRHDAGESVIVTRQGVPTTGFDAGGYPIVSAETTFTVSDVAVAPAGSSEDPQSLGLWVVTGYTLYLPYGTVLLPTDFVEVRGVTGWQVVGDTTAAGWRDPFTGKGKGSVVSVRRAG